MNSWLSFLDSKNFKLFNRIFENQRYIYTVNNTKIYSKIIKKVLGKKISIFLGKYLSYANWANLISAFRNINVYSSLLDTPTVTDRVFGDIRENTGYSYNKSFEKITPGIRTFYC